MFRSCHFAQRIVDVNMARPVLEGGNHHLSEMTEIKRINGPIFYVP